MNVEQKFELVQEQTDTGFTLYLRGELDLSMAESFRSTVEPIAHQPDTMLTLNLKDLHYIDSTGIGIFVAILKTRDRLHAPFIVEDVPPKVKRLFDMTGLSKFLTLRTSTERTEA